MVEDKTLSVIHFAEPGPQNTEATLEAACRRARELGIGYVVVATDTGKTARAALQAFGKDATIVAVTNPAGLKLPVSRLHDYLPRFREHKERISAAGETEIPVSLSDEQVAELEREGALVTRIDWKRLVAFAKTNLNALDLVGVAVRVAFTVTIWARLEKAIPAGVDVIALAGTGFAGGGADTAVVLRAADRLADYRMLEIVARPRESPPGGG